MNLLPIFFTLALLGSRVALAASVDVPISSTGGSISYSTDSLLRLRGNLAPPADIFELEEQRRVLFTETRIQGDLLRKVKYYLMNGEMELARMHLSKIARVDTPLRPIIYRYLATLYFFDGRFDQTYHFLSRPELNNIPHFSKICPLKVLSQIVLSKTLELESEWARCRVENQGNFRTEKLIWLNTLVELKLSPKKGVTRVPFEKLKLAALSTEDLKMILKLALYLNQEELVVGQIEEFTYDQYQDPEVRELAGQVFFRRGSFARAYKFIEDLKSPNSENMKGNFYVLRNKPELAYAQYKLALAQKKDSQNALERLLPLAWLLQDWEGGSRYAELVNATAQTKISKLILQAAFLTQKGDYDQALGLLELIGRRSQRSTEIEATQIASFAALMQNKPDIIRKSADQSCAQYDVINCWLLFQMTQWENFPLTVRRPDSLPAKKDWERLVKEDVDEPLKETVYINQLDIEEMDDKLIQLVKKNP